MSEVSRPAVDRDAAVARVDADGDPAGMQPRGLAHELGVLHRGGADDDARDALVQPAVDGAHVADAAAELHRHFDAARIRSTAAAFIGLPAKAPSRSTTCRYSKPCACEASRLRGGIGVEDRRLRHVAAHQAHAFAVLEVDRGEKDHGRHFRKLAIRASPSVWLFSGWNCVPTILSRPTIAVIGAAVIGGRDDVGGIAGIELKGMHEIGVQALRAGGDAVQQRVRSRDVSVFQPMCGIFRLGSLGRIGATSPAIQSRPATISCSSPRVAINCMPTQMPRNGRPRLRTALLERLDHAGDRVEPASAIGEGADARQHDMVGARDVLGSRGDHDLAREPGLARGALEGLAGGVQIARAVIDDGDAHLSLPPPGTGR